MIPRPEAFVTHDSDECNLDSAWVYRSNLGLADEQVTSLSEAQLAIHVENVGYSESDLSSSPNSDCAVDLASDGTASPDSAISGAVKPKRRRPQMMEDVEDGVKCDGVSWSDNSCPGPNFFGSLSQWSLTPSKVSQSSCVGGMLQRTFIHHPPAPPTPAKGGKRGFGSRIRSLSVPKDFGTAKCVFADALHSLVYLHRPVHSTPVSEAGSPIIDSLTSVPVGPAPPM
jgi:hypothetical protein